MRAMVLGGGGRIGRRTSGLLADNEAVESLLLADIETDEAVRVAASLGGKAEAVRADLFSAREIRGEIGGCDVVVDCLGSEVDLGLSIAEAAMDAGVDYVTNCDDWQTTSALLELDPDAAESGVLAVTGAGATPGLTNAMALHAANSFDSVDEIHIAWVGSTNNPSGAETVSQTLKTFVGEVPTYADGAWRNIRAGSGRELVWFPSPVGGVDVVSCGHPEPLTLPRNIDGLTAVTVKGSIGIALLQDLLRVASRLGLSRSGIERLGGVSGIDSWLPGVGLISGGPRWAGLRVEVRGMRNGARETVVLGAIDAMQNLAGASLAATALMVGSGEIAKKGVLAPEAVLDPRAFFGHLARWGIKIARLEPASGLAA